MRNETTAALRAKAEMPSDAVSLRSFMESSLLALLVVLAGFALRAWPLAALGDRKKHFAFDSTECKVPIVSLVSLVFPCSVTILV
jgi:hypothetical protein